MGFRSVISIIVTFNNLLNLFHLPALPFPFRFAHLTLALEQFVIRFAVRSSHAVPQSGELTIVVIEIEMVHGMTSSTIDEWGVGNVLAIILRCVSYVQAQ